MKTSSKGIEFLKVQEGFRATPYKDTGGRLTIGFGHLIKAGEVFGAIGSLEATSLLVKDVGTAETCVNTHVQVDITQNQFDALVSFVYNLGCKAFSMSTLLKRINEKDFEGAEMQFQRWNHVNGKVGDGITKRRLREAALFAS